MHKSINWGFESRLHSLKEPLPPSFLPFLLPSIRPSLGLIPRKQSLLLISIRQIRGETLSMNPLISAEYRALPYKERSTV